MESVDSQSESIWQGYVAAIASLLIGLLLLVSLFAMAIGLIGGLHETYRKAVQSAGFEDVKEVSQYIEKLLSLNDNNKTLLEPNDNSSFDVKAALDAYRLSPITEQEKILAQIAKLKLDRIDLSAIHLETRDLDKPLTQQELEKINFDAINWQDFTPEQINSLKPLMAQSALRAWRNDRAKPPPPIRQGSQSTVATSGDIPGVLRLVFVEESTHLTPIQAQQLVAWAKEWRKRGSQILVTAVWAGSEDRLVGRNILARMNTLRDNLLQAGIQATDIDLQLDRQPSAEEPKDVRIYIRQKSQ